MAAVSDPHAAVGGPCRLYLITPSEIDIRTFDADLKEALEGGDVACVQLRIKDASDDAVLAAADRLLPVVRDRNVTFLINDRPDLARAAGADGVHIGQQDASFEEARDILGDDAVIGVTCHNSRHLEARVLLADMNAVGTRRSSEVRPVVDQEGHVSVPDDG